MSLLSAHTESFQHVLEQPLKARYGRIFTCPFNNATFQISDLEMAHFWYSNVSLSRCNFLIKKILFCKVDVSGERRDWVLGKDVTSLMTDSVLIASVTLSIIACTVLRV